MQTVKLVLEDASRWRELEEQGRQEAQADWLSRQGDLAKRVEELQSELEKAQRELAQLQSDAEQSAALEPDLDLATAARTREGLSTALGEQCDRLSERSERVLSAEVERRVALEDWLAEQGQAENMVAYRQFEQTVRSSLEMMPASYREVVLGHHNEVVNSLRTSVAAYLAEPASVDADSLVLDLVFAVDMMEGNPDLLVVLTPIKAETYTAWADREADTHTWTFMRVVQGVYEALAECGVPGAQVMAGPHEGVIALEAEVVGAGPDLAERVSAALKRVVSDAPELIAAHLEFEVHQLAADDLLPPEEDEDVD